MLLTVPNHLEHGAKQWKVSIIQVSSTDYIISSIYNDKQQHAFCSLGKRTE